MGTRDQGTPSPEDSRVHTGSNTLGAKHLLPFCSPHCSHRGSCSNGCFLSGHPEPSDCVSCPTDLLNLYNQPPGASRCRAQLTVGPWLTHVRLYAVFPVPQKRGTNRPETPGPSRSQTLHTAACPGLRSLCLHYFTTCTSLPSADSYNKSVTSASSLKNKFHLKNVMKIGVSVNVVCLPGTYKVLGRIPDSQTHTSFTKSDF